MQQATGAGIHIQGELAGRYLVVGFPTSLSALMARPRRQRCLACPLPIHAGTFWSLRVAWKGLGDTRG